MHLYTLHIRCTRWKWALEEVPRGEKSMNEIIFTSLKIFSSFTFILLISIFLKKRSDMLSLLLAVYFRKNVAIGGLLVVEQASSAHAIFCPPALRKEIKLVWRYK